MQVLPPLSDFEGFGKDTKKRFMVTASMIKPKDENYQKLVLEEIKQVAEFKRQGLIFASYIGDSSQRSWHAFLVFREKTADDVHKHLQKLPLAPYLSFEITDLLQM